MFHNRSCHACKRSNEKLLKAEFTNPRRYRMRNVFATIAAVVAITSSISMARADLFFFSTGNPDGKIGTATRPDTGGGNFEIESADDFLLKNETLIKSATFTGIVPTGAKIGQVVVEIYRVF